jgi:hypothetical protein
MALPVLTAAPPAPVGDSHDRAMATARRGPELHSTCRRRGGYWADLRARPPPSPPVIGVGIQAEAVRPKCKGETKGVLREGWDGRAGGSKALVWW